MHSLSIIPSVNSSTANNRSDFRITLDVFKRLTSLIQGLKIVSN